MKMDQITAESLLALRTSEPFRIYMEYIGKCLAEEDDNSNEESELIMIGRAQGARKAYKTILKDYEGARGLVDKFRSH